MQYTQLIPIAAFSLIAVGILNNRELPLHIRFLALIQIALLYTIGLLLVFQDVIELRFTTLLQLCIAQCVWQMIVIEAFYRRIGDDNLQFEKDQLRQRFGLGRRDSYENQKQYVKQLMQKQLGIGAYYLASSALLGVPMSWPTYAQCALTVFQAMQLAQGLPIIAEATVGRLRRKQPDELLEDGLVEMSRRKYLDEDDEVPLWGSGRSHMQQPTFAQKASKSIGKLWDYTVVFGTLATLIAFLLSVVLQRTIFDTWEQLDRMLPPSIDRGWSAVAIKLSFLGTILYAGERTIPKLSSQRRERVHLFKKDVHKMALEGSYNLARMLSTAVFLLVVFYPSMVLANEKGEPMLCGQLVSYLTERIDYKLIFLGELGYMIGLFIVKLATIKK